MLEHAAQAEFEAQRRSSTIDIGEDVGRHKLTLVALALIGIALLYTLGLEQGSILQGLINSQLIHELVHDARHAAGFPCH